MRLESTSGCAGTSLPICQACARYGQAKPHITTAVTADGEFCEERRSLGHAETLRQASSAGNPLTPSVGGCGSEHASAEGMTK